MYLCVCVIWIHSYICVCACVYMIWIHIYLSLCVYVCSMNSVLLIELLRYVCMSMLRKPRGLPRWKLEPGLQMPQWMNGFRYAVDVEYLHSKKFLRLVFINFQICFFQFKLVFI